MSKSVARLRHENVRVRRRRAATSVRRPAMPKLRVHNYAISLDGYAAGPRQTLENPLGEGGERLHEWVFATRYGRRMIGEEGGDEGIDQEFLERGDIGIGA